MNPNTGFSLRLHEVARYAKLLAHPARCRIIKILSTHDSMTCGQLVAMLPLAQATVSVHLDELVGGDLVQRRKDGRTSAYSLNAAAVQKMEATVHEFLSRIIQQG